MDLHALRGLARRIAGGASVLGLVLAAAACTGGDEEEPGPSAPNPTTSARDASDGGGEEAVTDEDLTAASDRFLGFLGVVDDQDWAAACGFVLDPATGTAPEGERLQECADGAHGAMTEYEGLLQPGSFDELDASMVQAEPTKEDTIELSVLEQDVDMPMVRGDDGQWYLSIPF